MTVLRVFVADDRVLLVYMDGTVAELLAPGRPGGIAAHSTSRRRA